jgi:hypothetical protein
MPIYPVLPTAKRKYWIKGNMSTGTGGWGYVFGRPVVASDVTCAFFTGPTFSGTSLETSGTGVYSGYVNTGATSATMDGSTYTFRVVSFGIRVRYTGTELERGGTIYLLEHPNHGALTTLTAEDMLKYEYCDRAPVDREWHSVIYQPRLPNDYTFSTNEYGGTSAPFMAIMIAGASTNPINFDYEVVVNVEIMGYGITGKTSGAAATEEAYSLLSVANQTSPERLRDGEQEEKFGESLSTKLGRMSYDFITGLASQSRWNRAASITQNLLM